VLEVAGLRKSYGATVALAGVTFQVPAGEMFGFVGANGAGKTTTMRIIMGVLAADAGEVRWHGQRLGFDDRRRFGYMPEERGLYAKMRVAEQIRYFAQLHGRTPRQARLAADRWIERLGLVPRRDDFVEALSLGNQQRVQLAAALAHEPELLVLDEPFSGLDPLAVDVLAQVLAEQCAAGVPVIFSSHQLELVERLSDSVGIIAAGRLVASGEVSQLRQREAEPVLRVVLQGAPPGWADELPGTLVRQVSDSEVLMAAGDDQAVLRAAAGLGRVTQFGVLQPSLAEIFREAVA
jgi:ABC-2 type transport system ATP-binding protein